MAFQHTDNAQQNDACTGAACTPRSYTKNEHDAALRDAVVAGTSTPDAATCQQLLATWRESIDTIDTQLVYLLGERCRFSLAIRAIKQQLEQGIFDAAREEEIFEHIAAVNNTPFDATQLESIFKAILRASKEA